MFLQVLLSTKPTLRPLGAARRPSHPPARFTTARVTCRAPVHDYDKPLGRREIAREPYFSAPTCAAIAALCKDLSWHTCRSHRGSADNGQCSCQYKPLNYDRSAIALPQTLCTVNKCASLRGRHVCDVHCNEQAQCSKSPFITC